MRRVIYQATENGPDTRARLRQRITDFRAKWAEPFWDSNVKQSVHEPHLKWDEAE